MDQELKQRLIGAVVITALAAIFVPMLFDDPVDETGKNINALKVPEIPVKAQEVEIMPLPEKTEEIVAEETVAPKPVTRATEIAAEEEEVAPEVVKTPPVRITTKDTVPVVATRKPAAAQAQQMAGDFDEAEAEAFNPVAKQPTPVPPVVETKQVKPQMKTAPIKAESAESTTATVENVAKPVVAGAATRWYLQVGTFSQKANAVSKQDMLKQQGFAASVKEVPTDKGLVFKVRIGPLLDKAKAQAVKAKLTQLNVDSFVSADE